VTWGPQGIRRARGGSAALPRNAEALALRAFYVLDLGAGSPGLVNAGASISDGGSVTSVADANGSKFLLSSTGTWTYSLTHGVADYKGATCPVLIPSSTATLLSTGSTVWTGNAGNSGQVLNGAWALTPWTMRIVAAQIAAPLLGAGPLMGAAGHTNAQLGLGGSLFGGNSGTPWIGGNSGSNIASFQGGAFDLALPTRFRSYTLTYDTDGRARLYVDGQFLQVSGDGTATNWGAVGGIADAGFGLGGMAAGETWGTIYILRAEWYSRALSAFEIAYADSGVYRVFPGLKT